MNGTTPEELIRERLGFYDLLSFTVDLALQRRQFIARVNAMANLDAPDAAETLARIAEIDEQLAASAKTFDKAISLFRKFAADQNYSTTSPMDFSQ